MTDLITFLRARLGEDEWLARGADDGVIAWIGGERHYADAEPGSCRFIRHQLPSLVLREVEAKRAILELHPLANDPGQPLYCETCRYIDDADDPEPFPEAGYPCPTLRALAFPYSNHPDYDPSWRPAASPEGKP